MATADVAIPPRRRTLAGRLTGLVTAAPTQIVLLIVGTLWLVPSFGLLIASFRPVEAQATGWWNALANPAQLTMENYVRLLRGMEATADFTIGVVAAVAGAVAVVVAARLALAGGAGRWAGLAVGAGVGLYAVFVFWRLGGGAAVFIAVAALVTLALVARATFEGGSRGRLAIAAVLVVLVEVVAIIPRGSGILGALRNSVLITVPSAALLVLIAAGAAYAFAWIRFPGRDVLFLVVVGLLVVPLQLGLIPVASLFGALGLFGTIPGVVLFHIAFGLPFAVFLLRNFFIGIPHELLEAARMDGAGEWRVFSRVVLPLGIPAIASLLIFQFLWVWNDLLVALVFTGPESRPLTVAIQQQLRTFGANIDIIAPGAYLQMIVPLVVFFAFQRYFVQGLLAGSQR